MTPSPDSDLQVNPEMTFHLLPPSLPWMLGFLTWLYLTGTQSHGLMWFDSGELALAAHTWGLGHPPGQPFYTLLGALTSLTPFPLWLLNQISVISIALSIPALARLSQSISSLDSLATSSSASQTYSYFTLSQCLALGASTFLWTTLYSVWDQGTRIEVYALGSMLGLWALALAYPVVEKTSSKVSHQRSSFFLGLCGATQPIFAIGFGLALLPIYLKQAHGKQVLKTGLSCLLGLILPHLYLLSVVGFSSGFIWGSWESFDTLIFYFSGADYGLNQHHWQALVPNVLDWCGWAYDQGQLLWCLTGLAGVLILRSKVFRWTVLCLTLACLINPMTYVIYWPEVPDYSGYLLPLLSFSLIGIWTLIRRVKNTYLLAILVLLLSISTLSASSPPWKRSRTQHHLPLTIARNWLTSLPQDSALFVSSDHWVFPLMYAQTVEGLRPDIMVFNVGFAQSSWYWKWLKHKRVEFPSLDELNPLLTGQPRLTNLAERFAYVFAENAYLAQQIGHDGRWGKQPPCASGWGVSLGCEKQVNLPSPEQLRALASLSDHHDEITQRVLARLGLDLTEQLWHEQRPLHAITLGFAALGKSLPPQLTQQPPQWWPAPPILWKTARAGLIGSPDQLHALLLGLAGL